ncbi:MAG: hypothetical protein JW773_11700 [Desulfuromonadales bacterium]|nr:hypothetical protein [Desulfuromonadales bacterium]
MADNVELPAGLHPWSDPEEKARQTEGFELALLEDCDNAYRFTAIVDVKKVASLFGAFSRFLSEEAFFILEFYPDDPLQSRRSGAAERPVPEVYYSPYLSTDFILSTVAPYIERLIHDGFVGFGLANNRKGLEFFYSEEKVLTFFTDNHLRLSDFLYCHQVPYNENLILPSEFGHDHLSLLSLTREQLPQQLKDMSNSELDASVFCHELTEQLDMYQVEEGLSFFLTRKEQEQIAQLIKSRLPHHEFSDLEFGGLLLDWSDFVAECENAFDGDLWEYRQGLRIRDAIQLVIEVAPNDLTKKILSIVAEPDRIFQNMLTDRRKRLDAPNEMKLQHERFWYQGMVRNQGSELRRDLIRHGWFNRTP